MEKCQPFNMSLWPCQQKAKTKGEDKLLGNADAA